MSNLTIANTIWNQILAGGKLKVMCWGIPMKSRAGQQNEDGSGFLQFKVSGMKFKGIVKVIYNPSFDLYNIQFIKEKKKKDEVTGLFISEFITENEFEGIYCDQLTEIIDEYVEKIPAYKY